MIVPVLLAGLALILAYIGSRKRLTPMPLLFVTLFFGGGAAIVVRPDWATHLANTLNVGRGADLLLYFAVLCGVLIAANFFFRFKQIEHVLIMVVRRLAILSPLQPPERAMNEVRKDTWVVIPAYNEARVLRRVVAEVRSAGVEVVVVDDGSTDATAQEALAGGATVLRHFVNLGQGAALQTGTDYALTRNAQYICTFDADGQHAPESLAAMARVQRETGADVVLGSRLLGTAEGIPKIRWLMLRVAVALRASISGSLSPIPTMASAFLRGRQRQGSASPNLAWRTQPKFSQRFPDRACPSLKRRLPSDTPIIHSKRVNRSQACSACFLICFTQPGRVHECPGAARSCAWPQSKIVRGGNPLPSFCPIFPVPFCAVREKNLFFQNAINR